MKSLNKILFIYILIIISSCTTTKVVEVPVDKIKIEYRDKLIKDSIYIKDSVDTSIINDTVYKTVYKYRYKYKAVHDTVIQRDTIPKIVNVETVKEVNKLKHWQEILMIIGGGSIIILLYKLKKIIL